MKFRLRLIRLWWCRRRGHPIKHPVVMTFGGVARRLPDGTLDEDSYTVRGTVCTRCDKRGNR